MNETLQEHMEQVRALIADPLRVARDAAQSGTRVIAHYGNDVPVALILAAGALPLRLRGVPRGATPRADQFLESAFSPELRALVEQWLAGELDFIESVVFPRTDDSAQRLYYYLCELQRRGVCRGPRPLLFDTAPIARPVSLDYTRESTQRLASELGADETRLAAAVRRVDTRDSLLSQVRERRAAATPLAGSLAWSLERISGCDWRDTFELLAQCAIDQGPRSSGARRIVLAGDPLPDDRLHRAIEDTGGSIVAEWVESVPERAHAEPPLLVAIADQLHARRPPVLSMRADAAWGVGCVQDVHADAMVFWLIEEDESLPWEIARQMRSLAAAGIPALMLARQSWQPDDEALRRVRKFVATLENKQ